MPSTHALPLDPKWTSEEEYIQSLLSFVTSSDLFRNLCGGVHILDFLTREPDLFSTVLPREWREWFDLVSIENVLDLLLRRDLSQMNSSSQNATPSPPAGLLEYIRIVRSLCLRRDYTSTNGDIHPLPRQIAVGMKPKKAHEVANFVAFIDRLTAKAEQDTGEKLSIVDFGSGQNYLGRTLALPPYNKNIIAIERKHHNIDGAKGMDVLAKLTKKEKIMRNKKEYKRLLAMVNGVPTPPPEETDPVDEELALPRQKAVQVKVVEGTGSMTYIEHDIEDGHLESILYPPSNTDPPRSQSDSTFRPKVGVISLHSCGNLSHHGIRSLSLNPSVSVIAIIGCCYNLLTERLGPASYKLPQLRPNHPRLIETGNAFDPHGFPMSRTLENYTSPDDPTNKGIRLNITARMMAVQAPYNWGKVDSEAFFRRHFYRALLQRILMDFGVVKQCSPSAREEVSVAGGSLSGADEAGTPLIIGTLGKSCFVSFQAYVSGALAKLYSRPEDGEFIRQKTRDIDAEVVKEYETNYAYARKNLAVIWSLIAFSAGVVESLIVVDRWLFLKELDCVAEAWVESVFEYRHSPRNLVVVGIKKT